MNPQSLLKAWSRLATPVAAEQLEASETSAGSMVWYACDRAGDYHLLVRVPEGTVEPESTTKGLTVKVSRHRIPGWGDTDCIDLVCAEESTLNVFAAVASELIADLNGCVFEQRAAVVTATLARWRWFWDVETNGLSEEEALGLFGELWFLDQWMGVTPQNIAAWGGGDSTRHDFQWPNQSVEVKATARRGDGATIHTVQHLDQLADPESGMLYLFSLRTVRDRLASNTLASLVSRCSDQLRDAADIRDSFLRMVSRRGFSPVDISAKTIGYRTIDEQIYEVTGEFPRLSAASFAGGIPSGVVDITYKIDLSACEPWRRDRDALQWLTEVGRDSGD